MTIVFQLVMLRISKTLISCKQHRTIINRLYSSMTKILVFDTETTGLPKYRNPSIYKPEDWASRSSIEFLAL